MIDHRPPALDKPSQTLLLEKSSGFWSTNGNSGASQFWDQMESFLQHRVLVMDAQKNAGMETRNMWITMEMNTNLVRAFSAELSPWQIHQNENFLWKHISWQEEDLETDTSLEPRIFKLSYGEPDSDPCPEYHVQILLFLWLPFLLSKKIWKHLKSWHFRWSSCFLIQVIFLEILIEKPHCVSH